MTVSDEQRAFYASANPMREFETVVFEHSSFPQPIRLVFGEYQPQQFHGDEYVPVAGKVTKPDQGSGADVRVGIQFSRIHIGDNLLDYLKMLNRNPKNWQEPIKVKFERFKDDDRNTALMIYDGLTISGKSGIRFNRNNVTISCEYYNPMRKGGAAIYLISDYQGLASL